MSDKPSTSQPNREQMRRQFLEQAAAAFERMFPVSDSVPPLSPDQRQRQARELGQQLAAALLQERAVSDAGFLQAIFEHPEDDTPRLIYADWLDDNGQPALAEFIRLQCRLAALDPDDPQRDLPRLREETLLKDHGSAWMAHLPPWARKGASFQRGFANHFTLKARDFLRQGKALRKLQPFDSLCLTSFEPFAEELVTSGLLAGIRRLHLTGSYARHDERFQTGATALVTLLHAPVLAGLESLELSSCPVTEEVCQALAAADQLNRVQRLALPNAELRPAQAEVLSGAPLLGQLRELDLSGNSDLGVTGVEALARSSRWRQLRRLSRARCYLGPEELRVLTAGPIARGLTSLSLVCGHGLGPAIRSLTHQRNLSNLVHLDLHNSGISDEAVEALANAPHLPRLATLGLGHNSIGAEGVRALTQGSLLGRLNSLYLGGNKFEPAGWQSLAGSPACRHLIHLDLGFGDGSPEEVAVLAASPHLSSLAWLCLSYNNVGVRVARALAASTTLPALRYLGLFCSRLGSEGASALASSPLMNQLERLVLGTNGVSMALRGDLQARFGHRVQF